MSLESFIAHRYLFGQDFKKIFPVFFLYLFSLVLLFAFTLGFLEGLYYLQVSPFWRLVDTSLLFGSSFIFLTWFLLIRKKRGLNLHVLGWVSMSGIAVGVLAFLIIQSVMAGFRHDLQTKLIRFSAPLTLTFPSAPNEVPSLEDLKKMDPRIQRLEAQLETEGILSVDKENAQGVKLKGMERGRSSILDRFQVQFGEGLSEKKLASSEEDLPGILVGSELAGRLGLSPVLKTEVDLIYPFGEVDPSGEIRPEIRRFRTIGVFKSGFYDYDQKFVILDLSEARRLVPSTEVPLSVGVWFDSPDDADEIAKNIAAHFSSSVDVRTWAQKNAKLFSALTLEKRMMAFILGLLLLIASFNIFSLTLMMGVHRRKEIAILRTLGLSQSAIRKIFSRIGLRLAVMGILWGSVLGGGVVSVIQFGRLPLPSFYYLDRIPVRWEWKSVLGMIALTLIVSLLACLYPALKGGRFKITEALRYE